MNRKFPNLISLLFRLRFRRSSDFVLGDLMEEYSSGTRSRAWLWREAVSAVFPGSRPQVRFYSQQEGGMKFFSSLWMDIRYAARTLRKNPAFTAVAVIAIALGIGVNTGIFTILDAVALRPVAAPEAGRLVGVYQTVRGMESRNSHGSSSFLSLEEYQTYRGSNHTLEALAAYQPFLEISLGGDPPRRIYGQTVSCNYFEVMRVPPKLGRVFNESECRTAGDSPVVVLSHDLWRDTFGSDPAIIGRRIVLNRHAFTVVGVAAPDFRGTEVVAASLWAPFTMQAEIEPGFSTVEHPNTGWLTLIGRRKPDVSLSQVRADLDVIASRIDQLTPGRKTQLSVATATSLGLPEARTIVAQVGSLLLAAVGMVLLIACANVANLLLARAAGRSREIAIRLSVGAGRARLVRQLLTESLLIALLGGTIGSLIAVWSFRGIAQFILGHLPAGTPTLLFNIGPDIRVLGYALAMTIFTGVLFGLAPALQASRPDLSTTLKDGGSGLAAKLSGGFLRHALVGCQVAVSMILLIAGGLLLRGLYLAQTLDPGFEMKNIAIVDYDLKSQGYNPGRAAAFNRQLTERVAGMPGVDSVVLAKTTPLSDNHHGSSYRLEGETNFRGAELNAVSAGYFSMLGIPIVRGRNFTDSEVSSGARVSIVTEYTARHFWPNQDPLGKSFTDGDDKRPAYTVIGVAKDAQVSRPAELDRVYLYFPMGPEDHARSQLLVHSSAGTAAISKSLRAAVRAIDPDLPVEVSRLEDNLEKWRTPSRIVASLAGALGGLALILASVGIYGVVSYGVSRRVKEIGVRMTLGAGARDVTRLILWQAMRPVFIGAVLGIGGSAAVSRLLKSMLFGASALDPIVFVFVPLFLMLSALLASYIPARRAVRVDPMVALRYE